MKKEWISICSTHLTKQDFCHRCQFGYYEYVWKIKLERFIYNNFPHPWERWVNRGRKKK